jgi:hypothetical protein
MTDERQTNHAQNSDERPGRGAWDSLGEALDALVRGARQLWRAAAKRQLAMRDRAGRTLFRLPLTLAGLIALFLLWRAAPLLLLGVILVLALRGSFVILRPDGSQG